MLRKNNEDPQDYSEITYSFIKKISNLYPCSGNLTSNAQSAWHSNGWKDFFNRNLEIRSNSSDLNGGINLVSEDMFQRGCLYLLFFPEVVLEMYVGHKQYPCINLFFTLL